MVQQSKGMADFFIEKKLGKHDNSVSRGEAQATDVYCLFVL